MNREAAKDAKGFVLLVLFWSWEKDAGSYRTQALAGGYSLKLFNPEGIDHKGAHSPLEPFCYPNDFIRKPVSSLWQFMEEGGDAPYKTLLLTQEQ